MRHTVYQTNVKGNGLTQGCIVIFSSGVDLVSIPPNLLTDGLCELSIYPIKGVLNTFFIIMSNILVIFFRTST